jgi:transcriptional regulator with XRE-family HTH domain
MQTFWDRVFTLLDSPSVVELAKTLDVNRSTLSSWIHNDRRPPMLVAMKIAKLTGVSLDMLEHGFDWDFPDEEEGVAETASPLLAQVTQSIRTLDEYRLGLVKVIVDYLKDTEPGSGN